MPFTVMVELADKLAEQVYEVLNFYLHDYYTGWTPASYQRTMEFLHSAVKTKAKPYKNGARAYVYIDYDTIDYKSGIPGLQVVKWANEGLHGGIPVGHSPHVWDDTIQHTVTNGYLLDMAIDYLRSKGFNVLK